MKPHKWAKEIKAWADGAEAEFRYLHEGKWSKWEVVDPPVFNTEDEYEYRIKPQPKEPQYLYVYKAGSASLIQGFYHKREDAEYQYIGKIKLEEEQ